MLRFLAADTAADAIATWAIEVDGRLFGKISQTPSRRYAVTDAGPYCRIPCGDYASREGAARALVVARGACRAEQVDASGLMQIERDVLDFEADHKATEGERQREAARLGITVISYRQIARRMRLDARAAAYSPKGVANLREQHEAALARTARFRRPAAPVLAQAS